MDLSNDSCDLLWICVKLILEGIKCLLDLLNSTPSEKVGYQGCSRILQGGGGGGL